MKSRIVRQILVMGTAGASATVVVILASVKVFPLKSRLCRMGLATARVVGTVSCDIHVGARVPLVRRRPERLSTSGTLAPTLEFLWHDAICAHGGL
jgi:hypothetical protein